VLSATQRETYVDKLIVEMEHYVKKTKAHLGSVYENEDEYAVLGSLGAVRITVARLKWPRDVRNPLWTFPI
jgi:hypothetical protein